MNYKDINDLKNSYEDAFPVEINTISEIQCADKKFISINNLIPIVISNMRSSYEIKDCNIPLKNEEDIEIGTILYLTDSHKHIEALNESIFISFLIDSEFDDFKNKEYYEFKNNYLLLNSDYLNEYIDNYYETAPLWGNLNHYPTTIPYKKQNSEISITAIRNLHYPTEHHKKNALRVVEQPYAFERFLKKYHHLELLFDKEFIDMIIDLKEDYHGLNKILNIGKTELDRLQMISKKYSTDIEAISKNLNSIEQFLDIAKKVFFEYGNTSSDPLKGNLDLLHTIVNLPNGFNSTNCIREIKNIKNQQTYENFIIQLTTFWIYRIRCSIAHNKIGEYMFSLAEEEFLVEFAEPLLDCIILQTCKNNITH